MAVPLKYNLRHLVRRWRTTSLTVFAISLVVAMFVCVQSLGDGMAEAFASSGEAENVHIMRRGATAETNSSIDREVFNTVKFLDGIARNEAGDPIAAAETINIAVRNKVDGGETSAIFRGTGPQSHILRPDFKLVEGRMINPGLRELIVGVGASRRFQQANVGDRIRLTRSEWTIVGKFECNRTAFESEYWGDVEELNQEFDRTVFSSALLRAGSVEQRDAIIQVLKDDKRFSTLSGQPETAYYDDQTKTALPIQFLGSMLAIVMSVGAVFAAMNTMYAAISNRSWEVATLRVLGFSRRSILVAFITESVLIALVGGVIGGLMSLPMNGVATGTSNMITFSEVAFSFRITPGLFMEGMIFAGLMGLVGGFFPALQASRRPIVTALREG